MVYSLPSQRHTNLPQQLDIHVLCYRLATESEKSGFWFNPHSLFLSFSSPVCLSFPSPSVASFACPLSQTHGHGFPLELSQWETRCFQVPQGSFSTQPDPETFQKGGLVTKPCPTVVTPWNVACQASLSMGFSRQEYWNGLPFPSPGNLPNPGIKHWSPALAGRFFTNWATREASSKDQTVNHLPAS